MGLTLRKFLRIPTLLLLGIVLLGFGLRWYKIDSPIADWHSFRQADTAAIARNFVKFGFDPLRPRYDDLSNIQSGKDNPLGWRMVEFPLYQSLAYFFYAGSKVFTLEVWLRLVSIGAALGTIVFIAGIGSMLVSSRVGLLAAFLYAVLPFAIYYGRAILPEQLSVFFAVGSVYWFIRLVELKQASVSRSLWFTSAIFAALTLLIKPTTIFLLPPILYLSLNRYGFKRMLTSPWSYLYLVIVFLPVVAWRYWIQLFPEGIPDNRWLFNSDGIRFKGAWFHWLFGDRIAKRILGYWGVFVFALGLIARTKQKSGWFFHWLWLGALTYLIVFATGNVRHDYYQVIILPPIVLYCALGIDFLVTQRDLFNRLVLFGVIFIVISLMFAFSWYEVREYYKIGNPAMVEAGKAVDEMLPKEAKVIAPYNGDTAFLYQINRQGWPIGYDIEDKIKKGATHYVSVNLVDPEIGQLKERYQILTETESFIIISLEE